MIPQPVLPNGTDQFRAADGTQCNTSLSPTGYVEGGTFFNDGQQGRQDIGGYVRVLTPFGSTKERIDCKRLFDFEMSQREQQHNLERLKDAIFSD